MSTSTLPLPALPSLTVRSLLRRVPHIVRNMAPPMLLDGVCPLVIYMLLRPHFAPASPLPLAVAVLFPLLGNTASIARRRRLDTFGLLVLLSLAASLAALLIHADARTLLLTRNLQMPVMGLACLVSLLLPKPFAFYMLRQLLTGDDPTRGAMFDAYWRYPYVRTASRVMTAVWGVVMLGEFALRIGMVLVLPVAVVLAASYVSMMAISLVLGVWNLAYGARVLRQLGSTTQPVEADDRALETAPGRHSA